MKPGDLHAISRAFNVWCYGHGYLEVGELVMVIDLNQTHPLAAGKYYRCLTPYGYKTIVMFDDETVR